jgi:sugar lactone lactonase YvrE
VKLSGFRQFVLGGWVAAIVAGCGGSMPPIGAPGTMSGQSVDGARSMQLLYVAENTLGRVDVYDARKPANGPIAKITDGVNSPVGLCIDGNGVLYVLNVDTNSISEYEPGKTKPFQTISKGLDFPEFCAIDHRGNLWVTNLGGNNVTEYKSGATTPSGTIINGVSLPTGIALDRSGNLYVAGLNAEEAYVAVFSKGGKSPSRTITDGVVDPDGIAVDAKGTLYVTNLVTATGSSGDVAEYKAGQSQPYQAITGMSAPTDVIVNKAGYAYVSESATPAVVVFKAGSTEPWREFQQGMNSPAGIAYYVGTPPR